MSGKPFAWQGLAALFLIGLLIAGGLAVHYLGWSQGYAAGQPTAEGEEFVAPAYQPHAWPMRQARYPFMAGGVSRILCMLIFCIVIAKLFRFVFWGPAFSSRMGGPGRHGRIPHPYENRQ